MRLEWAIAAQPLSGEPVSGDAATVQHFEGGSLVAVVDGLGHGAAAAEVAQLAIETVEAGPEQSVGEHLKRCHERLKGTRGAVMSLARFEHDNAQLTWGGVGNVDGVLLRSDPMSRPRRHGLVISGGIVGSNLGSPRTSSLLLIPGDVVVLATDGLRVDLQETSALFEAPQAAARLALQRWSHGHDDALVLVARWLGPGARRV